MSRQGAEAGDGRADDALKDLTNQIRELHGPSVDAVLYYGSCLRSGNPFEGIVDLYLIVERYTRFHRSGLRAMANRLLPPDVFYREFSVGRRRIRAKYNVISMADFDRGLTGRWHHSYLWGRFSQPVDILWARDEKTDERIRQLLDASILTFLNEVLPVTPPSGRLLDVWREGLRLSYETEIRSEHPDRATELVEYAGEYLVTASASVAGRLRYPLELSGDGAGTRYRLEIGPGTRRRHRWKWQLRKISGKSLSLTRLVKALFTFDGGLDYIAWKLSRHSGQTIEIPERVRRHPLIFVWPLILDLYRRGVIR